jgi:hypothetical protein
MSAFGGKADIRRMRCHADVGQRLNPLAPEAIPGHFRLARLTRYDGLSESESVQ